MALIESALSLIGKWLTWEAIKAGRNLSVKALQGLGEGKTLAPRAAHKRLDLAFELFLSSKLQTEFILPADWDLKPPDIVIARDIDRRVKTYGHEFAVLQTIAGCFSTVPVPWDIKAEPWEAHPGSQVMLGSGRSNRASTAVLGMPSHPLFTPRLGDSETKLEYSIGMGEGTFERLQYNEIITRQALAICAPGRRIVQAEIRNGEQIDDYLLVTRLPGPTKNSVFTVLSGLHGPGSRSSELLFTNVSTRDLEELAVLIGHKSGKVPYFQAVFRASRFVPASGSCIPTKVELVMEGCPPKKLRVS